MKTKLEIFIFLLGTISAFFAPMHESISFLSVITLLACLAYLFGGWYLLGEQKNNKPELWSIIIGFLFASSLLSAIFAAQQYPGMRYFAVFSMIGNAIFIVFLLLRKEIFPETRTKVLWQLYIMAGIGGIPLFI